MRRRLLELGVEEPKVVVELRRELSRSAGGKLQLVAADPAATRYLSAPGSTRTAAAAVGPLSEPNHR